MATEVKAPERKLIIPQVAEAALPKNMPTAGELEHWDKQLHREFKKKNPLPGEADLVFTPFHMFPEHDTEHTLVHYRYNVAMVTTVETKPNVTISGIKQIMEVSFFADVKLFLDQFAPI